MAVLFYNAYTFAKIIKHEIHAVAIPAVNTVTAKANERMESDSPDLISLWSAGKPQNYGLLEKKQEEWRKDVDIMLGRRTADTTHHEDYSSVCRTAVRRAPPPPPPATCLLPRRSYNLADKKLPCGEREPCIQCEQQQQQQARITEQDGGPPCVDALVAMAV